MYVAKKIGPADINLAIVLRVRRQDELGQTGPFGTGPSTGRACCMQSRVSTLQWREVKRCDPAERREPEGPVVR